MKAAICSGISIAVIIATKNRPDYLSKCVRSIMNNSFCGLRIIIVDQSKKRDSSLCALYKNAGIRYFRRDSQGKSDALNYAISQTCAELIVFVDDDCVVPRDYITTICRFFQHHHNIDGVFGNSLPYRPHLHKGLLCPATFVSHHYRVTTDPNDFHFNTLGKGNAMILRRRVLLGCGAFLNWLGPGDSWWVTGGGGEETEYVYRALRNGFVFAHVPNIYVYHNRWVSHKEYRHIHRSYSCGIVAFLLYRAVTDTSITLFRRAIIRVLEELCTSARTSYFDVLLTIRAFVKSFFLACIHIP